MLKIYSNDCPKCKTLKKLLDQQNVPYEEVEPDLDLLRSKGFSSLPIVQDGDQWYDFRDAMMLAKPCPTCKF